MTQFGYIPSSASPAARRIYEAGLRREQSIAAEKAEASQAAQRLKAEAARLYADQLRAKLEREALAIRERADQKAALRRRAAIERIETAVKIARALPHPDGRSVHDIMQDVCSQHGISMVDLIGPKRNKKFVRARQHAMWLCHRHTPFSTVRLGKFFQRDHTTVLHAIQAHEKRMGEKANG